MNIHPEIVNCVNAYLNDCLTAEQVERYVSEIPVNISEFMPSPMKVKDWRQHLPFNLVPVWNDLPIDVRLGVAVMAMGAHVGALGSPGTGASDRVREAAKP